MRVSLRGDGPSGFPCCCCFPYTEGALVATLFAAHTGIEDFSLQQPVAAAQIIRASYDAILPGALALARWLVPMLMVGWAFASGVGRTFVLRALAPNGHPRVLSLCLLQLLRVVAVALTVVAWFAMVRWAALREVILAPTGTEANMVGFAAWLICLSLGSFVVWALWSWVLSMASVLIVLEGRGLFSALASSVRLGPFTMKLVEVNLVLGIVKLALIVLAMVFSAVPLPFEAQMSGNVLYLWWAAVGVLYLAASDFFQVARLAAFIAFWQRRQKFGVT